ncbi:hypothetical protein CHARACLAT_014697 [Characodon lateralis]|uniref:Uncharacterized protein n=1 Tax=Characodon lateralis TaxID=208331 RepID=A0ABU7DIT0_9TELE|nr:hypothetical protein [Characodon lateralis]
MLCIDSAEEASSDMLVFVCVPNSTAGSCGDTTVPRERVSSHTYTVLFLFVCTQMFTYTVNGNIACTVCSKNTQLCRKQHLQTGLKFSLSLLSAHLSRCISYHFLQFDISSARFIELGQQTQLSCS